MRTKSNVLSTRCWADTAEGGRCPAVPTTGRGGRHSCHVSWSSTGMGHGPWGQSLCNLVRLAGDQLSAAFQTCKPESHSAHTLSRPRFARELPLQALTPTAISCHPACTPERCLLLASNSQPRSKLDRPETFFFAIQWTKTFLLLQESPKSSMFILSWVLSLALRYYIITFHLLLPLLSYSIVLYMDSIQYTH